VLVVPAGSWGWVGLAALCAGCGAAACVVSRRVGAA
jgi:hypothetical protein